MQKIINTGDLPEEEVKLIADFIEFFKTRKEKEVKLKEREDITFITWHLEVKGKLRREEIYDYL